MASVSQRARHAVVASLLALGLTVAVMATPLVSQQLAHLFGPTIVQASESEGHGG